MTPFRSILIGLVLSLVSACSGTVVTDQAGSGGAAGLDGGGHDAADAASDGDAATLPDAAGRPDAVSASGCIGPLKGDAIPLPVLCAWSLYFCTQDVPPPEPLQEQPLVTAGCQNAITQGSKMYNLDSYCCWE